MKPTLTSTSNSSKANPLTSWFRQNIWRLCTAVCVLSGVLITSANCTDQAPGISPDPTQIHYPIGIAVHPSGKFLYVANSNFDLAFTGGTVMAFSTEETKEIEVDRAGVKTKVKSLEMLPGSTVTIGSFAGQLMLSQDGSKAYIAVRQDRRKDTPIDVSSIVTVNIDTTQAGKGHLKCDEEAVTKEQTGGVGEENKFDNEPPPRCGDTSKLFLDDSPYPYSMAMVSVCKPRRACTQDSECSCSNADKQQGFCTGDERCDYGRCVTGCNARTCKTGETCTQGRCRSNPTTGQSCQSDDSCSNNNRCDNGRCTPGCQRQVDCPVGNACILGRCRTPLPTSQPFCMQSSDCTTYQTCTATRLLASHIERGGLSDYSINATTGKLTREVSSISSLPSGVTSLALLPTNPILGAAGNIFVSSNQNNQVYILPNQLPPADDALTSITFNNTDGTNSTFADLRGVAVGYDKKNNVVRLFVASRRPTSAILVYNLAMTTDGKLNATLQRFIPVGSGPSHLLYHQQDAPKPDLLYVVCSQEGRLDVVNTETLQVEHQIKVGTQPAFVVLYDPKPGAEVQRRRAYVSNFLDTSISIIDLDSHQVIGQVEGIETRLPLP